MLLVNFLRVDTFALVKGPDVCAGESSHDLNGISRIVPKTGRTPRRHVYI